MQDDQKEPANRKIRTKLNDLGEGRKKREERKGKSTEGYQEDEQI